MKIDDFKNIPVCYPKNEVDLSRYEIPRSKKDFFTTKYTEFDISIPLTNVPGLYMELGVFKGRSLRYLADHWTAYKWYGFDTFEGINETWDLGQKKIDMKSFKVPEAPKMPDNVELIVGRFEDTLENFIKEKNQPVSFLNMDADVYSATKFSLVALNDWIVPGTIIRFDELSDWRILGYETDPVVLRYTPGTKYTNWEEGEWKALTEWLKEFNRKVKPVNRSWCQSATVKVIS
jgi:hypothetical protein